MAGDDTDLGAKAPFNLRKFDIRPLRRNLSTFT